jgi:hypothetical protein
MPNSKKDDLQNCNLYETMLNYMHERIEYIEDVIDDDINPIHRIEHEAKRCELYQILRYLENLTNSVEEKVYKEIYDN